MAMPYYLAPMAALSHRALRELIYSFGGCDEYFTEMISAPGLLDGGPLERYYVDTQPDPGKVVFQLVGAQEDQLLKAALILDKFECAGLDINMGCSAHEIVKIGAGSAWLARPEAAATLIRRLRRVLKHRLGVKLRLVPDGTFKKLVQFCRLLEGEGVELITLHPRMVKEKLKRRARWDQVAALRGELHIPVVGNGDIGSAETLVQRACGSWDAVMVGRGAVQAPWIFAQGRALEGRAMDSLPDRVDLLEVAETFMDLLERHQPPAFFESRSRRFFHYFCDNLRWAHYLKTLLGRQKERSGLSRTLGTYFEEHPEERYFPIPKASLKPCTT